MQILETEPPKNMAKDTNNTNSVRRRAAQYPRHRIQREASSSSSVAEDDANISSNRTVSTSSNHSTEGGQKRRRKRKRPADDRRKSSLQSQRAFKQKATHIERALLQLKNEVTDSKTDDDDEYSVSHLSGKDKLRRLAESEGGLINDDLRKKVWPRLVDIDFVETSVVPSQSEIEANKNYNQVLMDVNRSLKRFPPGISDEDRPELQDQLTRLIIRVLAAHPELHYYQGYHDVAITFLLVVGEEMAFNILEMLSTGPCLKEFMEPTMERTTYLLNFMYPLIDREDPILYEFLEVSEVGTIFALPWLITWFGHVLPNYNDVVRLYDYFLSQPPMMPVYLAATIVLHRRQDVLMGECDLAAVHGLLSRIPLDSPPFEELLVKARQLYDDHPPETIQADVDLRIKKMKEELAAPRPHKSVIIRSKIANNSNGGAGGGGGGVKLFKRFLFFAAPVLIGVVLYRYVQDQWTDTPLTNMV